MLKKRFIGVITVKDGWAVQSFGYRRYLPVGRPEIAAENLDRWGADEIVVISIDRSSRGLGPDLDLVRLVGLMGLSTPLTYGGGIRSAADAGAIVQAGADRVCVDALLRTDPGAVRAIAALVGAQAVVGVLPLSTGPRGLQWLDHLSGREQPLQSADLDLFASRVVSEALVVDWRHEGQPNGFDQRLIEDFPLRGTPLIAFGGISEPAQMTALLAAPSVVAIAVGNFLAYEEHAVQTYKLAVAGAEMRPAEFTASP